MQLSKALVILTLTAGACSAQSIRWVGTTGDVSLSSSAMTATIQQVISTPKTISFETATVYCSVACDVAQAQNGTGATATTGTLIGITNSVGSPVTTFWTASNVGAGTALGPLLHVPAGGTIVIDLSKVSITAAASINLNYSITVQSITGTANITIIGSER